MSSTPEGSNEQRISTRRLPASYQPATWRGTLPMDTDGRVGLSINVGDGTVLRLSLDQESARHIAETLRPMQWVAVEEQLPTPGEYVLFVEQYANDEQLVSYGYLGHDGKWYDAANVDYDGAPQATETEVTHWMPLPDPPARF